MLSSGPRVVSVNISAGGIPKHPVTVARLSAQGLQGDAHNHDKHNTPLQAVSIIDLEDLEDLRSEGFALFPGATGENLTVENLDIDRLQAGDRLRFSPPALSGQLRIHPGIECDLVELELTKRRNPCYVLDAIDPRLKTRIIGRCGFLAKVIRAGEVRPGDTIESVRSLQATT